MKAISKEIEEKARKNTEDVDCYQEANLTARQMSQHLFDPLVAIDPWNTSEKTVDPIKIKTTMADTRIVESMPCQTSFQFSLCAWRPAPEHPWPPMRLPQLASPVP